MRNFTKEELQRARMANLYDYVMNHHAYEFKREGHSISLKKNSSIYIKQGYSGYMDFASGEKGNSVDFLTKHMGYSVKEAVFALCGESNYLPSQEVTVSQQPKIELPPVFPEPTEERYRNLFAYLMNRGLQQDTLQKLIDAKILYQAKQCNNVVFANIERDWGEIRGTFTYGKPYHGMVKNSRHDGFWYMQSGSNRPEIAYVCESAIDAISLYELHRMDGKIESAFYISVGGAAKQDAIDRIKNKINTVLAVDNDKAGQECRLRNQDLTAIIPKYKDWNEDLLARHTGLEENSFSFHSRMI